VLKKSEREREEIKHNFKTNTILSSTESMDIKRALQDLAQNQLDNLFRQLRAKKMIYVANNVTLDTNISKLI